MSVHPRLCGEHTCRRRSNARAHGSSPPVRGTPQMHVQRGFQRRFIPACAGNTSIRRTRMRGSPVHPRLCGEHRLVGPLPPDGRGSSPPVRGTHGWGAASRSARRFIPACAGNTRSHARTPCAWPVHPRLCGEHANDCWFRARLSGSSPPVRGTPTGTALGAPRLRFIPACAGNTINGYAQLGLHPVHPRLCGEHPGDLAVVDEAAGSSPPVRGTHIDSSVWRRR